MALIGCRYPVGSSVADSTDAGSECETDSDLEDDEDVGDLEGAKTPTPKSL